MTSCMENKMQSIPDVLEAAKSFVVPSLCCLETLKDLNLEDLSECIKGALSSSTCFSPSSSDALSESSSSLELCPSNSFFPRILLRCLAGRPRRLTEVPSSAKNKTK